MKIRAKIRPLTYDALRALPVYPWKWAGYSTLAMLIGHLFLGGQIVMIGLAVFVGANGLWFVREVLPAQGTRGVVTRQGDRRQRAGGVASWLDVAERASRRTLQLRAHHLRPSLASVPKRRINPRDVGVLIAKNGAAVRPLRRFQELWSSCEDTTLRVGSPGVGKTIALALHGIDAPGAVITTSTNEDLAESMQQARRQYPDGAERPVHVFNPVGLAGIPSTVRWNVTIDCQHYSAARRRAAGLIPDNLDSNAQTWIEKGRVYLALFLHGAKISERRVEDVTRWISDFGDGGNMNRSYEELLDIFAGMPTKTQLLRDLYYTTARTRSGITQTMSQALAWMADDNARAVGAAPLDTVTLDIPRLITACETLHCIGPNETGSPEAHLIGAFLSEIAHQARMIASASPRGRLDPFLTLVLDEAAKAVRLPLPDWTADMRGRGIVAHISVQGLAQLYNCWGQTGGDVLLGNVGTLILHGGGKDARELKSISELCGKRWQRVVDGGEDIDGDGEKWEKVPVASPEKLSNMLTGEVVVLKRNLGGAFEGRTPTVLERKGWRSMPLGEPAISDVTVPLQRIDELEGTVA